MPTVPQSRPGRYAELDTGQLADVIEHAYDRGEHADWEVVFELARRAMAAEVGVQDAELRAPRSA